MTAVIVFLPASLRGADFAQRHQLVKLRAFEAESGADLH
jgi:hypothetical protein